VELKHLMHRLRGKCAIVTGGAQGIGAGIAGGFAEEGADVAVIDIQPAKAAEQLTDHAKAAGRRAYYFRADVADEIAVEEALTAATAALGRIDILVNNAGVVSEYPVARMPVAEWDRIMAINLRGPFLCTRAVLPGMIEQGHGRIINVASQLGQLGGESMAHYSASKAGLIGFTKALAREVSHLNILVNAIAPGPIETEMLAGESEEWVQRKLRQLPMQRFGSVAEVVPTAVFLASDDSSYYTGQTLGPNGGDVTL
jgi:3-oxoacyl-[acyl-carrier protein] reductase